MISAPGSVSVTLMYCGPVGKQNYIYKNFAFRRGFPSLSGVRYSPYSSQARAPTRQRTPSQRHVRYVPTQTWTHDVCVLSKREDSCTPSREYHDTLNAAGIGKKRVVFDRSGNHQYFVKKMEEEFPKLARQQGAIEVLRSSGGGAGTRGLVVIPIESLQG